MDRNGNPRKLNLGCGQFPIPGHVNVDLSLRGRPDVVCDLDRFPYPFRDREFDRISASHVLEHLNDPFSAMGELHRMLRPAGELHVKVPHFSRGFTHPDHKRGFDVSFPLYFNEDMVPWYCGTPFDLKKMRLRWSGQPYLKRYVASRATSRAAALLGSVIDAIANAAPMVFSRLFAFWVGGFEEIEFVFVRGE